VLLVKHDSSALGANRPDAAPRIERSPRFHDMPVRLPNACTSLAERRAAGE